MASFDNQVDSGSAEPHACRSIAAHQHRERILEDLSSGFAEQDWDRTYKKTKKVWDKVLFGGKTPATSAAAQFFIQPNTAPGRPVLYPHTTPTYRFTYLDYELGRCNTPRRKAGWL